MRSLPAFPAAVTLLAGLLLPAAATAQEGPRTDQELTDDELLDHGYLFGLQLGGTWNLLGEEEIRRMAPVAVAGAMDPETNRFVMVIVEQTPDPHDLPAVARLLIDGMPLVGKEVEVFRELTFLGLPAVRFVVQGSINGAASRFCNTVVGHRGHLYQFLVWGQADLVRGEQDFADVLAGVSFLEGEVVPGRSSLQQSADAVGVGWRLTGGTFETVSPGLRVALDPAMGWHVAVGSELQGMNPEAEVGLVHTGPECYLAFLAERARGLDEAWFRGFQRSNFLQGTPGRPLDRAVEAQVGDAPVTLELFDVRLGGLRMTFAHGTLFHRGYAIQVMGWWSAELDCVELITDALAGMRLLTDVEVHELTWELAAQTDSQDQVGAEFSLRAGVFTDYTHDFTWTKPRRSTWRLSAGDEVAGSGARFALEEATLGVFGEVYAMPNDGTDAVALHHAILADFVAPGDPRLSRQPPSREIEGGVLHYTIAHTRTEDYEFSTVVVTGVVRGKSLLMTLGGFRGNVEDSREEILAALDAFAFTDELQPIETGRLSHRNHRLGFSFDASAFPRWRMQDITPPPLAAGTGSILQIGDRSESHGAVLMVICALEEGQDEGWFQDVVEQMMLPRFREDMGVRFSDPVPGDLAGLPCRHTAGSTPGGGEVHVFSTNRGRTFVALVTFDEDGQGPALERLKACLSLDDVD
jgi:hypothetical protein